MVLSDSDTLAVHLNDRSITGRLTRIWSSSHTTIGVVCGLMEGDGGNLGNFWNPQLTRRKLAASSRRLVTCSPDISAQWGRGRHHTPYSVKCNTLSGSYFLPGTEGMHVYGQLILASIVWQEITIHAMVDSPLPCLKYGNMGFTSAYAHGL